MPFILAVGVHLLSDDGTMSMNQRDDALVAIATTDATVMLVSLKAGGTGE